MAERLAPQPRQKGGVNRGTVRNWGFLCLVLGTVGFAIVQNGLLHLPSLSGQELLAAMEADSKVMGYATVALVLQAINCCAAPLFAFLLAEGFRHTRSLGKYFLRVLGVAVLSELPFNLAVGGKWVDTASRNPAFGLVLALTVLYFFRQYGQKKISHYAIRLAVAGAAVIWALMLGIQDGAPLVLLTAVLWLCGERKGLGTLFGCLTALACSLFSPFYMLSPMVFILLHLYNGEKGEENTWAKHLAYPAILLALGLLAVYVL